MTTSNNSNHTTSVCNCHGGPNCCVAKATQTADYTNYAWAVAPCNVHGVYNCMMCSPSLPSPYVPPVTPGPGQQQQWPPLFPPTTQLDLDEDDLDEKPHKCPICEGSGEVDEELYKDGSTDCRTCEGGGIVWG